MKRILTAILLISVLLTVLSLTACGGESEAPVAKDGKDGVGIIKAEIINEELWITYSNDPENPVNVGRIYEEKVDEDSLLPESAQILDYYPLADGTYGVKAGRAIYMEEIVVPEKFNGRAITQVLDNGFSSGGFKKITLPNSISSIGNNAFSNCLALEELTVPDSVISIGTGAFTGSTALKSVSIPNGVMSIGANAFSGCSALEAIVLPASVTVINASTFANCTALKTATLPEALKEIGSAAFNGCISLEKCAIPAGVTALGNNAFYNCKALKEVSIPAGLTNVAEKAFMECSSLTTVTIPKSIVKINERAFQSCRSLTTINFLGTKEEWTSITKGGTWDNGSAMYKVVCTDGTIGDDVMTGN